MSCAIKEASIVLGIPYATLNYYISVRHAPVVRVKRKSQSGSCRVYVDVKVMRKWIAEFKAGKSKRLSKAVKGKPKKKEYDPPRVIPELTEDQVREHIKKVLEYHNDVVKRQLELATYKSYHFYHYQKILQNNELCLAWINNHKK